MNYYSFTVKTTPETAEILMALMSELPFDTFEEHSDGFAAFLPAQFYGEAFLAELANLQEQFPFEYDTQFIEHQNWNALWESNFSPIRIGDFCGIRAAFHPPFEGVQYEITIQPEMAFGTGHHATTHMMIDEMQHLALAGKKILDYGCGTGILAILASMLGASQIDAVDIEEPAFENTLTNCRINHIQNVAASCGTLDDVKDKQYDVILANINRNVILDSLQDLSKMLDKGCYLLTSGFLLPDEAMLQSAAADVHFLHLKTSRQEKWSCMLFQKA